MSWNKENSALLLKVARESIAYGLEQGRPKPIDIQNVPEPARALGATFVTLTKQADLRGCIGSLEAHRPLLADISENAYAAAFRDPRFPALRKTELEQITIAISILTQATPIDFNSENDLIAKLRPGIDGLILEYRHRRGTFLPAVWEQIDSSQQFLRHLKEKAGLAPDFWSDAIKVFHYTTETVTENHI